MQLRREFCPSDLLAEGCQKLGLDEVRQREWQHRLFGEAIAAEVELLHSPIREKNNQLIMMSNTIAIIPARIGSTTASIDSINATRSSIAETTVVPVPAVATFTAGLIAERER